MNVAVVRPLVDRLYDPDDVSVVYCLLVNRVQLLREQSDRAHHQTVTITRAVLCELIAGKILRRFNEENPGRSGLLLLANVLVSGFEPFQNAPDEVSRSKKHAMQWAYQKRGGYERKLTALEIAIVSESKFFLSGIACQKVVEAVYRGRIVYTPTSFIDILPDHYKHKPISLYDPRKAPLLNQYRLIVPRTRNIIEICQFAVLLVLYVLAMTCRDHTTFNRYELCFCVYAAGWVLDEFASILEHGWQVHTQNLWSFLDITFVVVFASYLLVRLHSLSTNQPEAGRQALDILSIAAPILLPRLAFNLMPENMLFISLRAMMTDFIILTLLAIWCFAGFLLALKWLGHNPAYPSHPTDNPDPLTISKWMLWIWFGLDGTGIQRAPAFHFLLGPLVMILFAFLGNTLFLTVLVSSLSNTFAKLAADAPAEIAFRRAVLTFEGVKSDALFAYRPPFNILALLLGLPLKAALSPRRFHKVNVFAVRVLNAPILLGISLFERRYLWKSTRATHGPHGPSKRSKLLAFWDLGRFGVHADLAAVFEEQPPQSVVREIEAVDEFEDGVTSEGFLLPVPRVGEAVRAAEARRRRWSMVQ
ncbi:hypothetical protein H2201_003898 [Coniosporium apollinis]|uniref:Ion transport domain-containing protein n=2 Tax=Coniosporium TaxID=2810619 RepID=A0ABQ9NUB4_9PEZI|nr:hypothetical protein H2199_002286 [Cladosporium sp. JES 115]KAJ9665987.1 hypothetical protein H2201_003898 [Coniosporium apollinis]